MKNNKYLKRFILVFAAIIISVLAELCAAFCNRGEQRQFIYSLNEEGAAFVVDEITEPYQIQKITIRYSADIDVKYKCENGFIGEYGKEELGSFEDYFDDELTER